MCQEYWVTLCSSITVIDIERDIEWDVDNVIKMNDHGLIVNNYGAYYLIDSDSIVIVNDSFIDW